MERRPLALRRRRRAEELRSGFLVDACVDPRRADGLDQPHGTEPGYVARVLRRLEADLDVALCAEVVDLVRPDVTQQVDERGCVGEIAVVEKQPPALDVRVLVDLVQALGVEARGAADDPVHLVALSEPKLREVRTVLAGDARDQRALRRHGRKPTAGRPSTMQSRYTRGTLSSHPSR